MNLPQLTDAITERLLKAHALIRLMGNDEATAQADLPNAVWAISDLMTEARALYDRQWQLMLAYLREI